MHLFRTFLIFIDSSFIAFSSLNLGLCGLRFLGLVNINSVLSLSNNWLYRSRRHFSLNVIKLNGLIFFIFSCEYILLSSVLLSSDLVKPLLLLQGLLFLNLSLSCLLFCHILQLILDVLLFNGCFHLILPLGFRLARLCFLHDFLLLLLLTVLFHINFFKWRGFSRFIVITSVN